MSVRSRLTTLTLGGLGAVFLVAAAPPASAAPTPNPSLSPLPSVTKVGPAGTASLGVTPASGQAGTRVTATFRISGVDRCPAGTANFLWDSTDLGTAPVDPATCRASLTFAAKAGAGGHTVTGRGVGTTYVARAAFTVTAPTPSAAKTSAAAQPSPTRTASPKPSATPSPPPAPSAVLIETDAPIPGSDGGAFSASDPFSLGYVLGGVLLLLGVVAGGYAVYRFRRTATARLASLRRRAP